MLSLCVNLSTSVIFSLLNWLYSEIFFDSWAVSEAISAALALLLLLGRSEVTTLSVALRRTGLVSWAGLVAAFVFSSGDFGEV